MRRGGTVSSPVVRSGNSAHQVGQGKPAVGQGPDPDKSDISQLVGREFLRLEMGAK